LFEIFSSFFLTGFSGKKEPMIFRIIKAIPIISITIKKPFESLSEQE